MPMHRCPRCGNSDIHGSRKSIGTGEPYATTRTIEEYFCPKCNFFEAADSDNESYAEVMARWRAPEIC